ncbi:MAG: hypothetical protein IKO23_10570 [Bacteroidales bacterium]|nr:hypothetical protein [Bacteroidales bacterium]
MKTIISIEQLANLFADDLPQKSKHAGITLFSLDLYQASRLSAKTLERLQTHLRKGDLEELRFPEQEKFRYCEEFDHCEQHRCLTLQDFVAVEYAKSEGYILLAEKGYLSRYAMRKGVAVMSLRELEELCERRCRDLWRKDRLKSYYKDKADTTEEEPKQQPIDDDITF